MVHLDRGDRSGHLLGLRGEELAGHVRPEIRRLKVAAGSIVDRVRHPGHDPEQGHHDVAHVKGGIPCCIGTGGGARRHRVNGHSLREPVGKLGRPPGDEQLGGRIGIARLVGRWILHPHLALDRRGQVAVEIVGSETVDVDGGEGRDVTACRLRAGNDDPSRIREQVVAQQAHGQQVMARERGRHRQLDSVGRLGQLLGRRDSSVQQQEVDLPAALNQGSSRVLHALQVAVVEGQGLEDVLAGPFAQLVQRALRLVLCPSRNDHPPVVLLSELRSGLKPKTGRGAGHEGGRLAVGIWHQMASLVDVSVANDVTADRARGSGFLNRIPNIESSAA